MAATKRQKSPRAADRKRGRYGDKKQAPAAPSKKAAPAAPSPAPTPTAPDAPPPDRVQVPIEEWLGWIEEVMQTSPVENEGARRALAIALADARRVTVELGRVPSFHLTDGESRLLRGAWKEVRDLTKALGLDKIKRKKKRADEATAPPVPEVKTDADGSAADRVAGRELQDEGRPPVQREGPRVGGEGTVRARPRLASLIPGAPA